MGKQEVLEAVRDYLKHTGGAEVRQVWNGLERHCTVAEIRAALKSLGAVARVIGDWPRFNSNSEPVPMWSDGWPSRYLPGKFTVYKLAVA